MAEVSHLEAAFERITVNDENNDEHVPAYKPKVCPACTTTHAPRS